MHFTHQEVNPSKFWLCKTIILWGLNFTIELNKASNYFTFDCQFTHLLF